MRNETVSGILRFCDFAQNIPDLLECKMKDFIAHLVLSTIWLSLHGLLC